LDVLPGFVTHYLGLEYPPEMVAKIPVAEPARQDLSRLQTTTVDYLSGLNAEEKRRKLTKTSYKDYLLQYVKSHPDVLKIFKTLNFALFCRRGREDAVPSVRRLSKSY
jgi:hypothetical protein